MKNKDIAFIYGLAQKALQDESLQIRALELIAKTIEASCLEQPSHEASRPESLGQSA